jgi:hypothetical protein
MTITFSGFATSGTAHAWQVEVVRGSGTLALTWPAAVVWDGGTAPSTTASKKTVFTFLTRDGGTTIYVEQHLEQSNASTHHSIN